MPRLKQLDIQGFKSFAEPVTFVYPTGIAAIVGPNGSGKSNVADAIRWVLGEQRLTTIRGRTGEDMIFAGSPKRARVGMGRAALTFDNSDNWLAVDFAEVTVERRTYRDGKTDYMINGNKVRLMDLRDLLDRAGLGRDAYLIIGQGAVDQVLSLRPPERLALFEQAAGIAPYRARREDAVKRLADTQHNLERVHDIIGEIEPRLRRLQRQAERVEQHSQLMAMLNETLRTWYGYLWGRAVVDLDQARQHVTYRETHALQRLEDLDGLETQMAGTRNQIATVRADLATLHRESSERHTEAERQQRDLAVARERRRQLQARQEESVSNLVPLRAALEAAREEVIALEAELATNSTALADARAQLAEAEAAHRELEKQRHALLARQGQLQAHALEHRHRLADRQSRHEQVEARLAQAARHEAELTATLNSATERRRERQGTVETTRRALEVVEAEVRDMQEEEARIQAALETARAESEHLRRTVGDKQTELQHAAARLDALERLHAEGSGLYAGVRAAVHAAAQGELHGLPGTVAELIHVPPELDRAIEVALGGQLQNVIAATWEDARVAIDWLKRQRAGRATFLPLDNLRSARPLELPSPSEGSMQGILGLASDLVDYDVRYRRAVLLLLGRTAVAQSLNVARSLYARLRGGFQIVTLEGEIVRSSGSVTGGEDRHQGQGGGLLARERERRELPPQVAVLEAEVQAARVAYRENETRVQSLVQEIQGIGERRREAASRRREADRALESEVRALDKLIQETEWQQARLDEVQAEQVQLTETRARLLEERAVSEAALAETERQLADLEQLLAGLVDQETAGILVAQRTQVALLTQEHDNRRVLLETRQRELVRLERQISGQEERIGALEGELVTLSGQLAELQARYDAVRGAADTLAGQIPSLETHLAALEQVLAEQESQATGLRRVLREAEQRLSQAKLEANRREERIQALRHEIEESLGIVVGDLPETLSAQQPLPLETIVAPLPTVKELPEGEGGVSLEKQIRDLRAQLRRLEPVNPAAQTEYEEVMERHTFLREQVDDLTTASAHLTQIIAELDEMMETSFRVTFKAVASEFTRVFKLLFNGGQAKLELAEENGESGVEITARPPGKRTSGLGMLSGGERTLTAVALLFA
ncbi:MAG: chromosome segregation protein SMC, partial [Anaerolineae bacterium]|nr:chromosome segregation protein SMC [Anaerolineae bacterium]